MTKQLVPFRGKPIQNLKKQLNSIVYETVVSLDTQALFFGTMEF